MRRVNENGNISESSEHCDKTISPNTPAINEINTPLMEINTTPISKHRENERLNAIEMQKKQKIKEALERLTRKERKDVAGMSLKENILTSTKGIDTPPEECRYPKTMKETEQNKKKWPKNPILITGESILNNIEEDILKKKFNVRVRAFPGADMKDMYDYLKPLLRKEPKHIILHVASNDTPYRDSS